MKARLFLRKATRSFAYYLSSVFILSLLLVLAACALTIPSAITATETIPMNDLALSILEQFYVVAAAGFPLMLVFAFFFKRTASLSQKNLLYSVCVGGLLLAGIIWASCGLGVLLEAFEQAYLLPRHVLFQTSPLETAFGVFGFFFAEAPVSAFLIVQATVGNQLLHIPELRGTEFWIAYYAAKVLATAVFALVGGLAGYCLYKVCLFLEPRNVAPTP